MMDAARYRFVDSELQIHIGAWANREVNATKGDKKPRPAYKKFKSFFDYENKIDELEKNENSNRKEGKYLKYSRYIKKKEKGIDNG